MCDGLGNFRGDQEALRDFGEPSCEGNRLRSSIVSTVDLHGVEFCGVIRQEVLRLHSGGVERAFPTCRGESRRPDSKLDHRRAILLQIQAGPETGADKAPARW